MSENKPNNKQSKDITANANSNANANAKETAKDVPNAKQVDDDKNKTKTAQAKGKSDTTTASTTTANSSTSEKPKSVPQSQSKPQHVAAQPAQKKGGLVPLLALLLGAGGTGLAVYNYDQARKLTVNDYSAPLATLTEQTKALETRLDALEKKTQQLGSNDALTKLKTDLDKTLKAEQDTVNQRLSKLEQLQAGLSKTLEGDLKNTLNERLNEVSGMLSKIDQIELAQAGISQNLQQIASAKEATSEEGMAKREIGYLVRMADYKIRYEGDAVGATGLLKIAEDKTLLLNQGKVDPKINALRQAIQQLQGVKAVDNGNILSELNALSDAVVDLQVKKSAIEAEASTPEAEKTDKDIWDNMKLLFVTGGMKVIPGDPNHIDITAETGVYEKRFIQADLYTAALAVRSQDSELLGQAIASVNARLDKYFDDNDAAKQIRSTLDKIKKQKLTVKLPDFSGLVEQFNN